MRKGIHQDSQSSRLRPQNARRTNPITVQLCGESIHPVTSIPAVLKEQRLDSSWQQKSGCGVLVASHPFLSR